MGEPPRFHPPPLLPLAASSTSTSGSTRRRSRRRGRGLSGKGGGSDAIRELGRAKQITVEIKRSNMKNHRNDEINRGYFADIKEFNVHGGKVAVANKTIISSVAALKFPELEVYSPDGKSIELPLDSSKCGRSNGSSVSLICLSFRASSQAMIESWSIPFSNAFINSNIHIYNVSFIDSWVLSLRPVKQVMLRMMKKSSNPLCQTVYAFGDHYVLRKKLNIVNLLTGYPFLLDSYGRIRWQGFGMATEEELSSLVNSTRLLLDEK